MPVTDLRPQDLIPHRDRSNLVDSIIRVSEFEALTEAVVKREWPLFDGQKVHPLVLIELVAQSAGICLGWRQRNKSADQTPGKGWLVGIKSAEFHVDRIRLGACVQTRIQIESQQENYLVISGICTNPGEKKLADILIQVFKEQAVDSIE